MARQLIYTSASRGLIPGQSGYCTVARSRDLREALIPRLEKLSYYTFEPDRSAVICAHRIIDVRGTKFHVLTRIVDAGLDFTKRRSFLAHHVVLEPNEIEGASTPAEIFLKWKGWIDQWRGEPQWLEDNRPLPEATRSVAGLARRDVWITGNEDVRNRLLGELAARGAGWDATFTTTFQPGDQAADFAIKAAWPNTPGFEAAQRFGAEFSSIEKLQSAAKLPRLESTEPPAAPALAPPVTIAERRPNWLLRILPFAAVLLTLVTFAIALHVRKRTLTGSAQTAAAASAPAQPIQTNSTSELNYLLPARPTWIAVVGTPTAIVPLDELMRELRANEVFTKDLTCSLQTNVQSPPLAATLFAQPEQNLLRFSASNAPPIETTTGAGAAFKTSLRNSFAIEIPGRFRVLGIQGPVDLPVRFLHINTNVQLQPELEERVHRLELPAGGQLALRPLVESKGAWIDPLAAGARDFSIIPSTVLDLPAVQAHADRIVTDKEAKLRGYEEEQIALSEELKKLLTDAQTPEQLQAKDRLNALQLAIPKAKEEFESLRAKALAIPKDPASIDRFALFLCLSNVNTEIFRFSR